MIEKWIIDDAGTLINMKTRDTYDYMEDIVDLLNEQEEEIDNLKKELFSVTSDLIYETSSTPKKDIAEAKKEIYGDME